MKRRSIAFALGTAFLFLIGCNPKIEKVDFTLNTDSAVNIEPQNGADSAMAYQIFVGDTIHFLNASVDEKDVKTLEWTITKDSAIVNSVADHVGVTKGFDEPGFYQVRLCVNGPEDCVTKLVLVQDYAPRSDSLATAEVDTDGDAVPDRSDECPAQFGTVNGCPDADGDGIIDKKDNCPQLAGLGSKNGCPKPINPPSGGRVTTATPSGPPPVSDRDKDGIPDGSDECPTEYGILRGCPDSDGDGIADKSDKCPKERGLANLNGCPKPAPPPPPTSNMTGANVSARPKDLSCADYKPSFSVKLKPVKDVELSSFKVVSDGCGGLKISLNGGDINDNITVGLNSGTSQVSLGGLDDTKLEAGKTYTLSGSTIAKYGGCPSDKPPKLEDAMDCSLSAGKSAL